jgi:hypothetical protein
MGDTLFYDLPYPEPTASVDVPRDIKALAERIDDFIASGYVIGYGNLGLGGPTDGAERTYFVERSVVSGSYRGELSLGDDGALTLTLIKGGVEVGRLRMMPDGSMIRGPSTGVQRPVPFALWTANVTVPLVASALYVTTVTFPSGRFTAAPMVNGASSWHFFVVAASVITTTGVTIEVGHVNQTPVTQTISAYLTGSQMTPGSGPGRAARDVVTVTVVATCHTGGCDNGEIALTVETVAGATVTCGVCGELITDVVSVP